MAAAAAAADVIYQDANICILKPDSERGVPVFHSSSHPGICSDKLYSYNGLRKAKPELGLKEIHSDDDPYHFDYIYFRAPYQNTGDKTFRSYYDKTPEEMIASHKYNLPRYKSIAIIKVDPEKTYVYFSEARAEGTSQNVVSSRIRLSEYLEKIEGDGEALNNSHVSYNLKQIMHNHDFPTNRMWEVILHADFLDRSAYICLENDVPFKENSTMKSRQQAPGDAAAGAGGGGGGAPKERFDPIYLKEYKIQCPECKAIGYYSSAYIKHIPGCANENKIPNTEWSKIVAALKGGKRRRTKRRRLNRRRTVR